MSDTSSTPAADRDAPVLLKASDLPAHCPNPKMPLWNHHPRVFLDVTHQTSARCPYCGTNYQLEPGINTLNGH